MPLEQIDDGDLRFVLLEKIILFYLIACKDLCASKMAKIKSKENMVLSIIYFIEVFRNCIDLILSSSIEISDHGTGLYEAFHNSDSL